MRSPRTQRLPILTFSTPKRNRSHVTYTTETTTTTTETQTPALIIKPCTTTNKDKDKDFITLPLPEKEETPTPVTKKSDRRILRPLEVGTQLMCFWKDGNYHPAKIIQRRKFKSDDYESGTHFYEYYVHYTEFNRRLDEWVKLDRLDLNSVQKGANQKVKGQETNSKRGRGRPRKLKTEEAKKEDTGGFDLASLHEHEKLTKVKNIANIELGKYEIETWYFSPYPPEFDNSPKLYFCEFCLNVWNKKDHHQRHMRKCDLKHPPGNEIYRSGTLSMFEVDGRENKVYCQNLCYMAKFFLDHKTLLDDVDDFLFYVLCECDDSGCHMVAYFSKEKQPEQSYNLACILTLPPFQRKGYGKFLIEFSYELSKKEGKAGTPEKPLSDLGKISYKQYWTSVLLTILKKKGSHISVRELSEMTAIMPYDILCTLRDLNLVRFNKEGMQYICTDHDVLDFHLKAASPGGSKIDASKLLWAPYKEQEEPALIDIS